MLGLELHRLICEWKQRTDELKQRFEVCPWTAENAEKTSKKKEKHTLRVV